MKPVTAWNSLKDCWEFRWECTAVVALWRRGSGRGRLRLVATVSGKPAPPRRRRPAGVQDQWTSWTSLPPSGVRVGVRCDYCTFHWPHWEGTEKAASPPLLNPHSKSQATPPGPPLLETSFLFLSRDIERAVSVSFRLRVSYNRYQ